MKSRKLRLHRETVRNLDSHDLKRANGGVTQPNLCTAPGNSCVDCTIVCTAVHCTTTNFTNDC
ncbi:MAG TPA: hypothetical protein VKY89_13550 [Thermoanaerobaculia bacterium]|nr:hypothetical protein [Thermoanaerobaculia bacterium]